MRRNVWFIHLLILLIVIGFTAPSLALEEMFVYCLDVGQADATLFVGPDFTILVDAGDLGASDVVPHLQRLGVNELDLLILTHPHADHIGQVPQVMEALTVHEVWMSGFEHTTRTYERALDAILNSEAEYYEPRRGEVIEDFTNLRLEVLNPETIADDLHDTNIVVRFVYGDVAILSTGDAEKKTEDKILTSGLPVQSQILQLGHHGSRTSSSLDFLLAVQPEVAVYSAATDNSYGHPHSEVIDRLKILDIPVYGTDEYGTIVITTDGKEFQLSVYEEEVEAKQTEEKSVDLNTASWSELQEIVHIGQGRALEIMTIRAFRRFESLDDLSRVPGLGAQRIQDIKNQGLATVKE